MKHILKKLQDAIRKAGTLNLVLIAVFAFFLWFNNSMLQLFKSCGAIPETYACAVIAATIGECGLCGWIRTTKDKNKQADNEMEDDEDEY